MRDKRLVIPALFLLAACALFSGCAALAVTGAAVAGGTGTYYYVEGELRTDYYFPVETVWSAVEKTIADLKGVDVEPDRHSGDGKISAVINDEKVQFRFKAKDAKLTTLGIRVGTFGNETAAKLLHDRVADHLPKS